MNKSIPLLVAAVFALSALAMFRDPVVDDTDEPRDATNRSQPLASNPLEVATDPGQQVIDVARRNSLADSDLPEHVAIKYRFLLADVRLDARAFEKLAIYLLEREAITRAAKANAKDGEDASDQLRQHQRRLAALDAGIQALLPPSDQANYTALRDSDAEQQRLFDYLGGISNVAPLDEQQERTVLEAKLRQKQRYQLVERDCGLDRDVLSLAEREYAHVNLARGMKQYLDDFLVESAPVLTHDQFVLLRSYETTEFTLELDRLQRKINAK